MADTPDTPRAALVERIHAELRAASYRGVDLVTLDDALAIVARALSLPPTQEERAALERVARNLREAGSELYFAGEPSAAALMTRDAKHLESLLRKVQEGGV